MAQSFPSVHKVSRLLQHEAILQDVAHICSPLGTPLSLDVQANSECVTTGSNLKDQNPHKTDGQNKDCWSTSCPCRAMSSSTVTIMTTGPLNSVPHHEPFATLPDGGEGCELYT
ncbi:uncharacterized protein LOC142564433 isoform X2 [Dermacentor variabilis]|uniref:uncharacterized protein LOC142564433 isoform X2 n=1 Tax=Dermacentor variabilis TaxID=34621 RepID=UPI003F5B78B2